MADIAVTDEWVTSTFGDKLDGKNGLYIIFRVEGIVDGFILKHYGVNVTGDKLDLDIHSIERSISLEKETKIKIVSTMLKLGIKENCTLSGMGFVKKDNGIRPFVDVTDGTDTKTIRNRLDNESTINNFFNHNIYDWFIKEKIREHINDGDGGHNEYEDGFEACNDDEFTLNCKLNELRSNKLQLLYHFILKGNNQVETKEEYDGLLNALDHKEKDNFNKRVEEIAKIKSGGSKFISTDEISKNKQVNTIALTTANEIGKNIGATTSHINLDQIKDGTLIKKFVSSKVNDNTESNENTVNFQTNKYNGIKKFYGFTLHGGTNTDTSKDLYHSSEKTGIESNIKILTKFFRSDFKLILAIPGNFTYTDKTYTDIWNEIINTIHEKTPETKPDIKDIKEDLFSLFFVYKQYYDVDQIETFQTRKIYNTLQISNIIKEYNKVYYMNDAFKMCNYLSDALLQQSYESDNDHFFHIADLIEIYNWFTEKRASTKTNSDGEQVTTILRLLNNYFTDIETNFWWTTIKTVDNIIDKSIKEVIDKNALNNSMTTINENKLMTFVKINNYSDDLTKWNVTYMPYLSSDNNFLHLEVRNFGTNNSQKNFYFGDTSDGKGGSGAVKVQGDDAVVTQGDSNADGDDDANKKTYTFGGFSQVFLPNQKLSQTDQRDGKDNKNNDIDEMIAAKETETIIDKIIKKEKVFIFGYGASGAGKTAMLVYNNVNKVDGYCIRLCKEIAKEIIKNNKTKSKAVLIKLRIEEFYNNGIEDDDKVYNTTTNYFDTTTLTYKVKAPPKTSFNQKKKSDDPGDYFFNASGTDDDKNIDMLKQILTTYVTLETDEGKRIIKPTRNNPQSSRSHVMIYIDFQTKKGDSTEELGTLMIADLAGVENPFDPFDCDTIVDTFKNLDKHNKMPDDAGLANYFDNYATDEAKEGKIKLKGAFDNLKTYMNTEFSTTDTQYDLPLGGENEDTYEYKSDSNQKIIWKYDETYFKLPDFFNRNFKGNSKFNEIINTIHNNKKPTGYNFTNLKDNLDNYNAQVKKDEYKKQKYTTIKNDFKKIDKSITKNNKITIEESKEQRIEIIKILRSLNITKDEVQNIVETKAYKTDAASKQIYPNKSQVENKVNKLINELYNIYFNKQNEKFDGLITLYSDNDYYQDDSLQNMDDLYKKYLNEDGEKFLTLIRNSFSGLHAFMKRENKTDYINKKWGDLFPDQIEMLDLMLHTKLKTRMDALDHFNNIEMSELIEFYKKNETKYSIKTHNDEFNEFWNVFYFLSTNETVSDDEYTLDMSDDDMYGLSNIVKKNIKESNGIVSTYTKLKFNDLKEDDIEIQHITLKPKDKTFSIQIKLNHNDDIFRKIRDSFIDDFLSKNKSFDLKYKDDENRNINGLSYSEYYSNFNKINSIIGNILDGIKGSLQKGNHLTKENFIEPLNEQLKIKSKYDKNTENSVNTRADHSLRYIVSEIRARQKEGDYINKQLEYLRTTLFASMYHKSDGLLFSGPTIQPECENSMCNLDTNGNSLENCFLMKCKKVEVEEDSNLSDFLKDIVTKYFNDENDTIVSLQDKVDQALKNINILIFTVFNISEKKTKIDDIKFEHINEGDFLYPYVEPTKFIDLEPIHTSNVTDRNKYATNIDALFKAEDEHPSIKNTSIKNDIYAHVGGMKRNNSIDDKNSLLYKLDLFNASTPLGTLIFTDNMAKFGINKICNFNLKVVDKERFAITDYTDKTVNKLQYLAKIENNKTATT